MEEYEIRKEENIRFAEKLGFDFIDADYDKDNWFERVRAWKMSQKEVRDALYALNEIREERLYANENGFDVFATTLGISRWKDLNQINGAG